MMLCRVVRQIGEKVLGEGSLSSFRVRDFGDEGIKFH
jgi:hypothetical protein